MTPGNDDSDGAAKPTGVALDDRQLRLLRLAVIAMAVVLVLGFGAVIARIVYLVARGGDSQPVAASAIPASSRLALPAGAAVRHVALSGDRLAVHYEGPSGAGIVIYDLARGKLLSRVELAPEPPR